MTYREHFFDGDWTDEAHHAGGELQGRERRSLRSRAVLVGRGK